MKINTTRYAVWAGLLLCTAVAAYAVPVTFQIDMSSRTGLGLFNTDGSDHIEVQSGFNQGSGWAGNQLTNVPSTTLYQNTFDITSPAPGSVIEYKFHTWGTHDNWEDLPGYIYTSGGNRTFVLADTDQSVPSAFFNDVWSGTVPLTVEVDMLAQTEASNFTPGTDTVEVRGSWDGWSNGTALTNDPTGASGPTNVYSQTFNIGSPAPGGLAAYKFHTYGSAGHDIYESDPDRILMVTNPATLLPLACFNRACLPPIGVALDLQVDMSSQVLIRTFDKATCQVWAGGDDLGGWSDPPTGLQLFEDASRPSIYTNHWTGLMSPNATFPFKFKIWYPDATHQWEDALPTNRWVVWTGSEPLEGTNRLITYGPVLFNNFLADTNDYLPADTWVTFTVSMTNSAGDPVQTWSGFTPLIVFDKSQGVVVNGDWIPWYSFTAAPPSQYEFTNGTSGDWLYSQTVLVPQGAHQPLLYKYGIDNGTDSTDNEGGYGMNHVRYIRQVGAYTLPLDTFGVQVTEPLMDNLTVGPAVAGHVLVSWLGTPGVHLQTTTSLNSAVWQDHLDTTAYSSPSGIYSTNYPISADATFFRLVKP